MSGLPRLGQPAPEFEADSTHGRIRLSDFRGSWVVLFSHPADFTPVCTTEFLGFHAIQQDLKARGTELIGLSIDSIYAHLGWLENIRQRFGAAIDFPVIADTAREVAMLYGMIMPGESTTEAARCVFVIDAEGILRAMIYYPMTLGRNMDEILRVIDGLQLSQRDKVAIPANWRPGDPVILPAPRTIEDARARGAGSADDRVETVDWYFVRKHPDAP